MMPTRLSRSLVLQLPLHHLKECLNRSEVSPNVDVPDLSARDRRNTEIYGRRSGECYRRRGVSVANGDHCSSTSMLLVFLHL